MNLGPTELIIILVIVLLLFGSTRLPKLAKSLGEASKEFKKGVNERDDEQASAPPAPAAPTAPAAPVAATDPNEQVTMSRAELDALLAERERNASKDVPPPAQG
jgi:sec-independent protein translocase protein TatA